MANLRPRCGSVQPTHADRRRFTRTARWLTILFAVWAGAGPLQADEPRTTDYAAWIGEMKSAPRGPFARIRWFCADGSVLPPEPGACAEHGGGAQHGEWSPRTRRLREAGYAIANVYADLDVQALLNRPDVRTTLAQMLIEPYLVAADDGWILRRARFYRGAFQEEGERAGVTRLLEAMAARPRYRGPDFLLLRSAAGALDHGRDQASALAVRRQSAALAESHPAFLPLRHKIHGRPTADDAARVRDFAAGLDAAAAAPFLELAAEIDALFETDPTRALEHAREALAGAPEKAAMLERELADLRRYTDAFGRYVVTARLLALLREAVQAVADPAAVVALVDAGIAVEAQHFTAASGLVDALEGRSRRALLMLVRAAGEAAYGTGLIGERQRRELARMMGTIAPGEVTVARYRRAVESFALLPVWAAGTLEFQFGPGVERLTRIEPRAALYLSDRLRGSPVFPAARIAGRLRTDAGRLAGITTTAFGSELGTGARALNAGIARGVLRDGSGRDTAEFEPDGIYLLSETVAELPPVAGILTAGEGNPLSHVQLLARNLGIPNVALSGEGLDAVRARVGSEVMLAVSPRGSILIDDDAPAYDHVFGRPAAPGGLIRVDTAKLDLGRRDLLTLSTLRAADSGRVVGPKAAKLGELKSNYPEAVADGLAIPFGVFRALLTRPAYEGGPAMFEWMRDQYRRLQAIGDAGARAEQTEDFRRQVEAWILAADPGAEFRKRLSRRLAEVFGPDGSYGVFVRSDTNVEDLPGFTGAGLNLTVANVVGEGEILEAISRVWASPFSARAFAWRQTQMDRPEHVYPAVLLMRAVDVDKSGVMVTADIDSGDRNTLTVAVNEGIGGAVEGQSAESLRIDRRTGEVRLMAVATAPFRRQLAPGGGLIEMPASGADFVLRRGETAALRRLADELPVKFPPIVDADGDPVPADVEFGFEDGQLRLFQIRPFLESKTARASAFLSRLDAVDPGVARAVVNLDAPPR